MTLTRKLSYTFLGLGVLTVCVLILKHAGFSITYQGSASMARGFYIITPAKTLHRNDIVVFTPPTNIVTFLKTHPWAPPNAHLMKYIVAGPGDKVCKRDNAIFINDHRIAPVYQYYAPNHLLPNTPFCGKLQKNQYLLMSTRAAHSFDGRYFGPVDRTNIIGKATYII